MKINDPRYNPSNVVFRDIPLGYVFGSYDDNKLYMKVQTSCSTSQDCSYNAVDLADGTLVAFYKEERIIPIDAEMIVKDFYYS